MLIISGCAKPPIERDPAPDLTDVQFTGIGSDGESWSVPDGSDFDDPVYAPSLWVRVEYTGIQDNYSVVFYQATIEIDPEDVIRHAEMK